MAQGFASPSPAPTSPPSTLEVRDFIQPLQSCFSDIQDPRVERTRLHQLSDIIVIAVLSLIAGGQGWEDMEAYGSNKRYWLSTFLALPHGIPCADTFRRVFERIHHEQFEQAFQRWLQVLTTQLGIEVVAIDGKTLRGSYDRSNSTSALHLVSAWATDHRLVLAQTRVQDKSNEIAAIPVLLDLLDLQGTIVTMDAMGTQKSIAAHIIQARADYILCLKSNHPKLFQQVHDWFETARAAGTLHAPTESVTEAGHHRVETRRVWQLPIEQLPSLHRSDEWQGLKTVVIVERRRSLWNKTTHEVQFYLSSLPAESQKIGGAIRQHWGIENSLHWTLDVTFAEDRCRVRTMHAPHNLAILRRWAINSLNLEDSYRHSLRQKTRRAAMNDEYMIAVLSAGLRNSCLPSKPSCQ